MEPLTETIDLDLEESNDLTFKIKLEGTATSPAKVRLVCEGNDFSYMFNGYGTGEPEVVQFTLPQMNNKIQEGTYSARIEVLVENRYFAPLQFQINFKKTLSVVAEAIQVVQKALKPEIRVTAAPVVVQKPAQLTAPAPIQFEQRPAAVAPPPPAQTKHFSPPVTPVSSVSDGKFSSLREAYAKKIAAATSSLDEDKVRQMARSMLRDKLKK